MIINFKVFIIERVNISYPENVLTWTNTRQINSLNFFTFYPIKLTAKNVNNFFLFL